MTTKKIVHYRGEAIISRTGALLRPLDHPDKEYVSNHQVVRTSKVVAYDAKTCRIETANTIYLPGTGEKCSLTII